MTMQICPVCAVKFNSDYYSECPIDHELNPSVANSVELVDDAQVGITARPNTLVKFCAICGAARKDAESKFCGDCGASFSGQPLLTPVSAPQEQKIEASSQVDIGKATTKSNVRNNRFSRAALAFLVIIASVIPGAFFLNGTFSQKTVGSNLMDIEYVNFYESPPVQGFNIVHDYYCRENQGTHVMTFTSKSDAEMVIRRSPLVPYAMGQLGDEWWVARWKYSDECRAAIVEALQ